MTTAPRFDPEITALLDEIAADPASNLVRPLRPREWHDVPGITAPISPREPDLTKAERHLVEVYREEAAYLLGLPVHRWLFTKSNINEYLLSTITVDRELDWPESTEWTRRTARLAERARHLLSREELLLLGQQLDAYDAQPLRPLDLLVAANRLAPTPTHVVLSGLALASEGCWTSAQNCFENALRMSSDDLLDSYSLQNLGLSCLKLDRPKESLTCYARASKTTESRPAPAMDWLSVALLLQAESSLLEAARTIDEMITPEHPSVREKLLSIALTWQVEEDTASYARRIKHRLGQVSQKVADAVSQG